MKTTLKAVQVVVPNNDDENRFERLPDSMVIEVLNKLVQVVEGDENRFERLPDDMLIEILNKLVHSKHLLQCSPVCKRFGYLIHQIDTLFIPSISCFPANLRKFSAIKSIRIEVQKPTPGFDSFPGSFVQFKAVFDAGLEVLIVLIDLNFHTSDNVDYAFFRDAAETLVLSMVREDLLFYLKLHVTAQTIIDCLPLLGQVLLDTCRGQLYMGKDQIAQLRAAATDLSPPEKFGVKMLHARLELPASGRVMQHAHIAVVRPEGEQIVMERDLGLMLGTYVPQNEDDVGKILDEVVNVARKKIASDPNGDLISMHHLSLAESV